MDCGQPDHSQNFTAPVGVRATFDNLPGQPGALLNGRKHYEHGDDE
jgi:hypothetical protein